jgi:hypothetical protein
VVDLNGQLSPEYRDQYHVLSMQRKFLHECLPVHIKSTSSQVVEGSLSRPSTPRKQHNPSNHQVPIINRHTCPVVVNSHLYDFLRIATTACRGRYVSTQSPGLVIARPQVCHVSVPTRQPSHLISVGTRSRRKERESKINQTSVIQGAGNGGSWFCQNGASEGTASGSLTAAVGG